MVKKAKVEDFMRTKWRPMMAISYMLICLFDFIAGPILFNLLQYFNPNQMISAYQAVTLQGGGLFHLSMGAIVGISAHGRTKEKVANVADITYPSDSTVDVQYQSADQKGWDKNEQEGSKE